jgi:UDP-N-acetylmuramoyl-tripeptide--D-alanyl-D-alanine ligase
MAVSDRRTWAVLGPLGELGAAEEQAHRDIGSLAARLGVDRLVVVGEQAQPICAGAADAATVGAGTAGGGERPGAAPVLVRDVPAALDLLRDELAPGDVVLVKASRAFGLERIADGLLAPHDLPGTAPQEKRTPQEKRSSR